eukprot:TRINITY_DN36183_c0_g1_i1.p1 TRINITY_DN36183_c0_g1~~TRINITY_DN36183_c0_g1_i1.p1  ORF type:complete len:575 (+),score=66.32 TRINITY_DN36183_c0_g1_i1:69-1727(+)
MSVLIVLFATDEFGMNDLEASLLYGYWGILCSLWSGAAGLYVIDNIGPKRTALAGTTVQAASRVVLMYTRSLSLFKCNLLAIAPIAEGLLTLVGLVVIKRLTTDTDRSMAFALNFAAHNAGGGVSDLFVDIFRKWHHDNPDSFVRVFGSLGTPVRACLLLSEAALLLATFLVCAFPTSLSPPLPSLSSCWKIGEKYHEFSNEQEDGRDGENRIHSRPLKPTNRIRGVMLQYLALMKDRRLWFVCAVATCLTGTKAQWHHMNATMPKYLIREVGTQVPWGSVNSIHYWMCAIIPPFITALTSKWKDYSAILIGSTLMSLSPIFMAFEASVRAACFWMFCMSIGEVMWNPRFSTLSANFAPEGKEGAFMVIAYTPTFLAALPTGWLSGLLLELYCPDCPKCREQGTGSFCAFSCNMTDAPSVCNDISSSDSAADAAIAGTGVPHCATHFSVCSGVFATLDLHGEYSCPDSCRNCPGWSELENGPMLWTWVLLASLLGPLLLLGIRGLLPSQGDVEVAEYDQVSLPSLDGISPVTIGTPTFCTNTQDLDESAERI